VHSGEGRKTEAPGSPLAGKLLDEGGEPQATWRQPQLQREIARVGLSSDLYVSLCSWCGRPEFDDLEHQGDFATPEFVARSEQFAYGGVSAPNAVIDFA
jgi:hypothetical protein